MSSLFVAHLISLFHLLQFSYFAVKYLIIFVVCYRVISRASGLKLVVQTLLSSLRPIGNIVLICCTFFIIFGILGVQVCCMHVPYYWVIYHWALL